MAEWKVAHDHFLWLICICKTYISACCKCCPCQLQEERESISVLRMTGDSSYYISQVNPHFKVCFCYNLLKSLKCHIVNVSALTHVVVTKHYSLWLACGSGCVDQCAALIGFLGADDIIELSVRLVAAQLHKLRPLCVLDIYIANVRFQLVKEWD